MPHDRIAAVRQRAEELRTHLQAAESECEACSDPMWDSGNYRWAGTVVAECLALLVDQEAQIRRVEQEREKAEGSAIHGWSEADHQRAHKEEYIAMLAAADADLHRLREQGDKAEHAPAVASEARLREEAERLLTANDEHPTALNEAGVFAQLLHDSYDHRAARLWAAAPRLVRGLLTLLDAQSPGVPREGVEPQEPTTAPPGGRPEEEIPSRTRHHRTEEQLRGVLSMLCNFIWTRRLRDGEHLWSIPVDRERDFDCILADAIDELIELRKQSPASRAWREGVEPQVVNILQRVAELPDRTSPDDWPEAMLVTADELADIIRDELKSAGRSSIASGEA